MLFLLRIALPVLFLVFISSDGRAGEPATYYINSDTAVCNDLYRGISPDLPWCTLYRASTAYYPDGSQILLKGDEVFQSSLILGSDNFPSYGQPRLTITSYDTGRPVIVTDGTAPGVMINDAGNISISNILFMSTNPGGAGAGILVGNGRENTTISDFLFRDIEIINFTHGIFLDSSLFPSAKIRNAMIERAEIHGNANGISIMATPNLSSDIVGYAIENVTIRDSEIHDNDGANIPNSGSAIVAINVDGLNITNNNIYDNGGNSPSIGYANGASAITGYGVRATIEYNRISGQKLTPSAPADNAGIDIWGKGRIAYNRIFNNENAGIHVGGCGNPLECEEYGNWRTNDLTIAYNILSNNGFSRRAGLPRYSAPEILFFGTGLDNVSLHNNTIFTSGHPPSPTYLHPVITLSDDGTPVWQNVIIANNVIATDVPNKHFMEVGSGITGIRFEHNAYLAPDRTDRFKWDRVYRTLAEWAEGTGQERTGTTLLGREGTFIELCSPGQDDNEGYKLAPDSAFKNVGTNRFLSVSDPLLFDFFSTPLPQDSIVDMGAHEFISGNSCS